MHPLLSNFIIWGFFVALIFYLRAKRLPHKIKSFSYLPEEEILWCDPKVEITLYVPKKKNVYKTLDITITNQRILFSQFGFYEEIWDYTHKERPAAVRFSGPYHCLSKSQFLFERTFRGEQTLTLFPNTEAQEERVVLELTERESPYKDVFPPAPFVS